MPARRSGRSTATITRLKRISTGTEGQRTAPAESVTLTGCLHADGGKYMLTDLKGDQAPKGRSWKSGWIKKSTKDVEVLTSKSGPKLKDHVGHQVTLTGVRNGETHIQAKSIKHVAASCS